MVVEERAIVFAMIVLLDEKVSVRPKLNPETLFLQIMLLLLLAKEIPLYQYCVVSSLFPEMRF
jgi:hypothetical protein